MEKITNAFKKIFKYIKIVAVLGFVLIEEIVWDNIGLPAYNAVQSLFPPGKTYSRKIIFC